jgi:3-oxoacyl-(acyl-carrier-protein) synthase
VFATVHGATSYLVDFHRGFLKDGLPGAGPILFTNGVTNAPATHVSIEYSIRGRSLTLTGGALCAIEAIAAASSMLAGGCSAVLVSAGEEMLDLMAQTYGRFDAAAIPGRGKASPGAVPLCEGAAALVLGPGGGAGEFALEAWAFGSPSRDATGGEAAVEEAIRGCLDAAGLSPEAPDALVASLRGNGADAEELRGIAAAFRERRRPLPAAAPGANLGEGFAFQALLGVVAGLEVLRRGSVPPCALSPLPAPAGPLVFPDRPLRAPASLVLALHMDADRSASACLARRRG